MKWRDTVDTALRGVVEHRLRAGLSALGVVIGTASIVVLVSIGIGVKQDITRQVEQLGTNVAFVVPGKLDPSGQPEHMSMLGISTLTREDADALAKVPGVTAAIPVSFIYGSVENGGESYSAIVLGADHRMEKVGKNTTSEGRFYTPAEAGEQVCVIGHALRQDVFDNRRAIGQGISIRGRHFKIVGVLEPEEPSLFSAVSLGRVVYIPVESAMRLFPGAQVNRIILQTDYRTDPDAILTKVYDILRQRHGTEDFGVLTYKQLLGAIYRVFNIVTALIVSISAISLLVAGIGIMNVMLVSVAERTHEIGVRLTTGARPADIFRQFLAESVAVSVAGGTLGLVVAWLTVSIVRELSVLKPAVTPGVVLLAVGTCITVGLLAGTIPAARAARLSPVDALRHE